MGGSFLTRRSLYRDTNYEIFRWFVSVNTSRDTGCCSVAVVMLLSLVYMGGEDGTGLSYSLIGRERSWVGYFVLTVVEL